jgi:hypothetical protein
MQRTLLVTMFAVLVGCSDPHRDLENICRASERSGSSPSDSPSTREEKLAKWLTANVKSKETRDVMSALASVPPPEKGALLRREALARGVSPCPLADEMEAGLH